MLVSGSEGLSSIVMGGRVAAKAESREVTASASCRQQRSNQK